MARSKKIKVEEETAIPAIVTTSLDAVPTLPVTLQEHFEKYPNASIRKLAQATEINYGILLKKSKEPVVGEAYDPEAINWAALEDKLTSKNVDWRNLDWEAMNESNSRHGSALQKSVDAFNVGDKVYLRRNNETPYEIVYKTGTHIVVMLEGSSEPQAWANNTFLLNGPVFEPRAVSAKVEKEAVEADTDKEVE